MLIVSDVHGAADKLRRAAAAAGPLLILGDLINFLDYRTLDGIITEVSGREFVTEMVRLRVAGEWDAARALWREFSAGRQEEIRARYDLLVEQQYAEIGAALAGASGYVTYGNVDRLAALKRHLPQGMRFVDEEVVEIDGVRVGFAGGGVPLLGVEGEVSHEAMAEKLAKLGPVDVLCTHVPPLVRPLATDVIGGRGKGSPAVLDYLLEHRPRHHYFGDIHQPQAVSWRVGDTLCRNVGYFRATGRGVRHVADAGSAARSLR